MTPLVLLPEMMCDARLFSPQIEALSSRWTLVLPALGRCDSVAALAHEVLVHAPLRFALAGLAFGGVVALEILSQAPERVTRIALLSPSPLAEAPEMRVRRERQIARVGEAGLAAVMRRDVLPQVLGARRDGALSELCLAMALALGPEVFARQSRALADRPDQQEALRGFAGPALVLAGAEDPPHPRDRDALSAALPPDARLAVIEGAGRLPVLQRPEATTGALIRWLEA